MKYPTRSSKHYRIYLMARQQWVRGFTGDVKRDEAIVRICQQVVQLDQNYAQAWALMALAQAELRFWHGREEDALPAAERALSINSQLPEALCVKAHYLEDEGQEAEAISLIDTALRLGPESWEVNREAARMLYRQGRTAEAIPYFEKAVGLMNSDFHNPVMLISCYTAVGNAEAANGAASLTLERAERALAQDPTNGPAIANGAFALATLGEADRAKEWIERGLLLDPENQYMRYNVACLLASQLKDYDAAMDVLDPFFEQIRTASQLKHVEADPDLDRLRGQRRFKAMLAATKKRLGLAADGEDVREGTKAEVG
jgi:adenylate cyclase